MAGIFTASGPAVLSTDLGHVQLFTGAILGFYRTNVSLLVLLLLEILWPLASGVCALCLGVGVADHCDWVGCFGGGGASCVRSDRIHRYFYCACGKLYDS